MHRWRLAALVAGLTGLLAVGLAGCGGSPTAKADGPVRTAESTTADAGIRAVVGPVGDAFYQPPNPLPEGGKPGDVIQYRQVPAKGLLATLGAAVYDILYRSTDALGKPDTVSGVVVLPAGVDVTQAPIVSYAAGTHGLGDSCAPSKAIDAGTDYGLDDIAAAISRGWVVTATDYQGLGTPGVHTYAVGRSEGHAVIDAVRAAMRLPARHPSADAKVAYFGYSQGGGSAAWAGELSASYAPELNVVGIAAGGVPADLTAVYQGLAGSDQVGLAFMAAVGFDAAYPELKLDSFLMPAGRVGIDALRTGCISAIAGLAGKTISDVASSDPVDTPTWQARLSENRLGGTAPKAPIYLYHGTKDTTVAFAQDEALMRTYCAAGAKVVWHTFNGDHGAGSEVSTGALVFLADRFAGKPVTSTC